MTADDLSTLADFVKNLASSTQAYAWFFTGNVATEDGHTEFSILWDENTGEYVLS